MVLDPISVLGIAGNVLQFVDFAGKVVSRGTEYYKSHDGALVENAELSRVAENLSKLSLTLQDSLQPEFLSTSVSEETDENSQYSPAKQGLCDANKEYYKISVKLSDVLEALRITDRHRKWQSLWQALRSRWSEERIEKLSCRLKQAREQLTTHLLVHISSTQGFQYNSLLTKSNTVEQNILQAIQQASRNLNDEVKSLSQSLDRSTPIDRAYILEDWQGLNYISLNELSGDLHKVTENSHLCGVEDRLLTSLYFVRLEDRRDRIAEAHKQTFRWIFGGVREDGTRWDEFTLWLEGPVNKGLFWISGNAGSGKSTLMRYLDKNENTRSCLQKWAGSQSLITASCFFWKAGTPIQKSLTGMLRSLLHQILNKYREFVPDTNPWRWRTLYWGSSDLDDWTDVELVKAMHSLVRLIQHKARLAIFVDGLDEFEGDDAQMLYLIEFFQALAEASDVKICLSSRPWNFFQDTFADCPKLRLEQLTSADIRLYVQDNLEKSPRFRQLRQVNLPGCHSLINDVVEKANGVFLWVYLVIRELVKGLRNGHDLCMVRQRLDELPADLDAFFFQMINTIELSDRSAASKIFQTVLSQKRNTTLMTLSFLNEDKVGFALEKTAARTTLAEIVDINESMLRRLNHSCMGLLEAKGPHHPLTTSDLVKLRNYELEVFEETWNWNVDYLHRTVKDFLLGKKSQEFLLSCTDGEYDTDQYLCNAMLSQMSLVSAITTPLHAQGHPVTRATSRLFFEFLEEFMVRMEAIEAAQRIPPPVLLSNAEQVFSKHFSMMDVATFGQRYRPVSRIWESIEKWKEWQCSFLTLTLQYNIEGLYSTDSRSIMYTPQDSQQARPKLDFALRRWISKPSDCLPPKAQLIERILADGANPTEIFDGISISRHFLRHMATQIEHCVNTPAWTEQNELAWYQTVELLISYGAYKQREDPTVSDLLGRCFGQEAAAKLLRTSMKRSSQTNQANKAVGHRYRPSVRDKILPWRRI